MSAAVPRHLRLALPALLLAAGCWVPIERGKQMEGRLDRLEQDSREQQRILDEQIREKMAQIDRTLRDVQAKLDELNAAARTSGANLGVEVGKLRDELTRLRGDMETLQHRQGQLEQQSAAQGNETAARIAALKGSGALDEELARQRLAELPRPDDKGAVLALARKAEAAGEAGVAREIYLSYVRRWPRDEQSAEAGYRAGTLLTKAGRWREAVVVLGKVAEDHPGSDRAPDALALVAEGMVELGRKDDARAFLEDVIKRYPKSDAAAHAKVRLKELFPPKKAPPKKK